MCNILQETNGSVICVIKQQTIIAFYIFKFIDALIDQTEN